MPKMKNREKLSTRGFGFDLPDRRKLFSSGYFQKP
jgi:hypothetical protein